MAVPEPEQGSGGSPFNTLRHEDESGEYWLARELQPVMGYGTWERFGGVIERAIRSAENTETYSDQAFSQIREPVATSGNAANAAAPLSITEGGASSRPVRRSKWVGQVVLSPAGATVRV